MLLRATLQAFGQRYLLDFIVPGGTRVDLDARGADALEEAMALLSLEVPRLRDIYEEHAGLRDRFAGAGIVTLELAVRLGLTGLAGRASGQAFRPARGPSVAAVRRPRRRQVRAERRRRARARHRSIRRSARIHPARAANPRRRSMPART